jgi:AAA+ superfamily predicted ATPase
MSTDLHAALEEILRVAREGMVAPEEMPQVLLIMSDMQFNNCVEHDDRAIDMIRRKYEAAGYTAPTVVFWNLDQADVRALDKSVSQRDSKTAMVSGFSPAILKSVLSGNLDSITSESVMLSTIMDDRYDPLLELNKLHAVQSRL